MQNDKMPEGLTERQFKKDAFVLTSAAEAMQTIAPNLATYIVIVKGDNEKGLYPIITTNIVEKEARIRLLRGLLYQELEGGMIEKYTPFCGKGTA